MVRDGTLEVLTLSLEEETEFKYTGKLVLGGGGL